MKKWDFAVIGAVLLLALILFFAVSFSGKNGSEVIISQSNEVVFRGNLTVNQTIDLGTNTAVIKNGSVYMESASCKNQICVNHKKISKKGESIICLPNKVLIEIK